MVVDQVMFASVSSSVANPGTITFSNTNGTGIIVVVSSTEKVTAVQVGSATLKATSAGTSNYYPVTVSQAMTIKKTTPTLTITAPSGNTMMVGSSLTVTFTTSATFNRGGAKSYAVAAGTGSATINSSTGYITAVSTGTVTLTVSTAGDANYYPESTSKLMTITASMLSVRPIDEDAVLKVVESNIATEDNSLAERAVTIPMMLSPNGDGVDDVLIINHLEDYPENELVIANRNGEMVFKTHGYNNSSAVFSGVSNTGAPLADGVYYYTLVFYDQGRLNRRVGYFKLKRE
jgi:gliding motility-associated-like protein